MCINAFSETVKDLSIFVLETFSDRNGGYDSVCQALVRVGMDDDDVSDFLADSSGEVKSLMK